MLCDLPVGDSRPQLRVLLHHLLVIIEDDELLSLAPTGAQSGRVLRTEASHDHN